MAKTEKKTGFDPEAAKEKYSKMSQEELVAHAVATDEATEKIHADYDVIITELKEKASTPSAKVVTVKHEKKSYNVVVPTFRIGDKKYKAEDLLKLPKVVAELVETESAVLEEVAE